MLRYIGVGFIRGIPARDLSDDEVRHYGKVRLIKSGLYQEVTIETKPKRTAKKKAVKEKEI